MINTDSADSHSSQVEKYYRFHARIYDATRWSFLFGRSEILKMIPDLPAQPRILEVGCGTGRNIRQMQQYFPDAQIEGIDFSNEMLEIAKKKLPATDKIKLHKTKYGAHQQTSNQYDIILLSYSLTMMGNKYERILDRLIDDLQPEGKIAIVDFHTSPFGWFRRWMEINHVDFEGTLLPLIKKHFQSNQVEIKQAYLGLWSYFMFIGQPKNGY